MSDFWSNTAANLVGTFVGAGLALLTALVVSRRERKLSEIQRLRRLIDRIYYSRAFRPLMDPPEKVDPLDEVDFKRTTDSVLITRRLIEDAANSVNPKRKSVEFLNSMYVAILYYLNETEEDPSSYQRELMRLRAELKEREQQLTQLYPQLTFKEPGGAEPRHGSLRRGHRDV
jgi:hypothetical protein